MPTTGTLESLRAQVSEILTQNVQTLHQVDPILAKRICWPVGEGHVVMDATSVRLSYRGTLRDLAHPHPDQFHVPEDKQPVCLFGLGLGEALERALLRFSDRCIVVWERDPWLLRLFLARVDVRQPLLEGRLILQLGCDLEPWVTAKTGALWTPHPLLQAVYRREWRWLQDPQSKLAMLFEGGLFVDDMEDNLLEQGYSVYTIDADVLSLEEMAWLCHRLRPDMMAAINYRSGFAEFAESQNVPLLVWEIDPTTEALPAVGGTSQHTYFFTYRETQVQALRQNGFALVEYLPLASHTGRRRPLALSQEDKDKYTNEVSFVGSSMLVQAAELKSNLVKALSAHGDGPTQIETKLESIWQGQAETYESYRIPQLVDEIFPELRRLAEDNSFRGEPVQLVAEVAAARKRLHYIRALADFEVQVWGDEGWRDIDTSAGLLYRGRAAHGDELSKIYNASAINIDVNRIYQMDIVPMRIFDVLACGGFVLAEDGPAIAELFRVGEEVEVYRDLAELREKIRFYLDHPEARLRIAAKGHERVLADHSIRHRLAHMLGQAGLVKAA